VELYKSYWGIFDLISSRAFSHNNSFTRAAIEGHLLEESKRFAFYLADNDKPLSLCGKTVITGKSYLPKAGVKRAYIEGQYFSGDKLLNGEMLNSKKIVPPLDKEVMERLAFDFKNYTSQNETRPMAELFRSDSLTNSFANETMVFYDAGAVELTGKFISGNIIIVSDKTVVIDSDTRLFDVVIAAPRIIAEENFNGTCQIIASEKIEIKKNCIFNYPSSLSLCYRGSNKDSVPDIHIEEGATIKGVVISTSTSEAGTLAAQSKIIIEKGAQVSGQVYASANVDLKGSIYGSLICHNIILSTPSAVYENHLLNATVDVSKLSRYFTGINIDDIYASKKIIKWLY
jgi:cytoskeletal protein CcmA (bactofilin family)